MIRFRTVTIIGTRPSEGGTKYIGGTVKDDFQKWSRTEINYGFKSVCYL